MGEKRVPLRRLRFGRDTFSDGRGGLVDRVLFLELFGAFMRNLPEMPVLEVEDVDHLWLQKAGEAVLFSVYSEVGVFADDYEFPVDLLWGVVVDWVVSDHMGTERTPVEFLVPERGRPDDGLRISGRDVSRGR